MIFKIDQWILLFIQEYLRSDIMTPVMKAITHLGDKGLFWIGLACLFLFWHLTRKTGFLVLCSLAGSFIINNLFLKNLVARIRPYETITELELLIERQHDLSFPSGHSAASFTAAMVLYKLLPRKYGIPAIVLAALISLSRIYVGVHYPSDILAGVLSGTLIALATVKLAQKFQNKKNNPKEEALDS